LKHNGGNKTEREKLARSIFLAKIHGEKIPDVSLNLPPGYLENMSATKGKDKENGALRTPKDKDDFNEDSRSSGKKEEDMEIEDELEDDELSQGSLISNTKEKQKWNFCHEQ